MNRQATNAPSGSSPRGPAERPLDFSAETEQFRRTASEAASGVGDHLRQIMDQQVETGASMVGSLANSLHSAAGELEQQNPQVGKFARIAADGLDRVAEQLKGQNTEDLLRTAREFTQRQPALVFGAAALAGFFALRLFKTATTASSSSISSSMQPSHNGRSRERNGSHGL